MDYKIFKRKIFKNNSNKEKFKKIFINRKDGKLTDLLQTRMRLRVY